MRRARVLNLILMAAACMVTGCAADVVMMNPQTGETATCRESLRGVDPWSQKEACVGYYTAGGWVRVSQD
jgi:hypothetical protein